MLDIAIFKTKPFTVKTESGRIYYEPELLVGKIFTNNSGRFFAGAVFDMNGNYEGEENLTQEEFFERVPDAFIPGFYGDKEINPDRIGYAFPETLTQISHLLSIFESRKFSKKKAFDNLAEVSNLINNLAQVIANA